MYCKLFKWTIVINDIFDYASANPPKHIFKIPLLPIFLVKWN